MSVRHETLSPVPAARYRETFALDAAEPVGGAPVPAGWEGLYFPFDAPLSGLRPDGSPAADAVMPDFGLPRRMYAGEDTVFHLPLRFGDEVEQIVRMGEVVEKNGRSGRLVFADLVREYRVRGELAIESTWHDVFLEAPAAGTVKPAVNGEPEAVDGDWIDEVTLDSRQLFRYSALTFNTHRVHYDRSWAQEIEGLEDLLVHGPLMRMLLLDTATRHSAFRRPATFSFRSSAPSFVGQPIQIVGATDDNGSDVRAVGPTGATAARGVLTWA